jgi:aminoglycoside phosphotransferase (APT) family kinase protein
MTRNVQQLDDDKLASYLKQHVEGFKGPLTSEKFPGGHSNLTYAITAESGRYVLRSKPKGVLLKSAHAVDREFQVIQALANTDVPVARVYHLCEDDSIIGSMFYLMEYIDGKVYWDAALPKMDNQQRNAMYDEMNCVLTAMHSVDIDAAGLSDFGKPGNYYERQISRWSNQYRASETETIEAMETLLQWLPANMPKDDGKVGLVHGDFRLDNMMFSPSQPKILAVVDWELSTLGHPYSDLAYQCMQWRLPSIGQLSGLQGVDRKALGIPTEEEYVALYCQRMGIDQIDNWPFYLAFSFFRLAAILQGVKKRALEGNASNKEALKVGDFTKPLAIMAVAQIQ